jgi:Protein of unknown function (DUF1501)
MANESGMNRRHFLKHVAGASLMALPAMQFIRTIQANAQEMRRNNKSLIVLWMAGGPASIDIWDLKPGRPTGGPFREISTRAEGVRISEHMPRVAEQMRNLAIIRSLTTTEGDHQRGTQLMHSSYTPNPAIAFPSIGAVTSQKASDRLLFPNYQEVSLPTYINIGGGMGAQGPGFLGMNYSPFTIQNPGTPPQNITPPAGMGTGEAVADRIQRRRRLFTELEDQFMFGQAPHLTAGMTSATRAERLATRAQFADASKAHNDVYYKGFSLVASSEGKIFDLKNESQKTRDEYGPGFGQSALMARRLVEAGVSAVEISLGGWDTHNQTFDAHQTRLQPQLDRGMGTLVKELVERGRWNNTVIVWMGEFGRTPRINQNTGRDHWARCWSVVVGGGAIRGGQAYGTTDEDGMSVATNPVRVGDVFATIYRGLGIDPSTQVRDAIGRPFAIAGGGGRPIDALFA